MFGRLPKHGIKASVLEVPIKPLVQKGLNWNSWRPSERSCDSASGV